jgi:hypothetical protein
MQWLKRAIVRWLLGTRIDHLEDFANDATKYVNALVDFHDLQAHEVEEPDPAYVPPTHTVLRFHKRK